MMFAGSVIFQIVALWIMPLTKGLTQPLYSLYWVVAFLVGVGLLARLVGSGANLSTVLPAMAAVIPLCTIANGILTYKESASMLKVGLLCASCVMVGVASSL